MPIGTSMDAEQRPPSTAFANPASPAPDPIPTPTQPGKSSRRSIVLDGMMSRAELAQDLDKSERTIIRYERAGMPYIAIGLTRLYVPEKVRTWLLSHENRPEPPRRGRPRKVA